jgi:hypothetical protein
MAFKGFEVTMTTDVPVLRTSTSLPLPWDTMVTKFEAKGRKPEELPSIIVPKEFWTDVRGIKETDTNEEGKLILTDDIMAARIKAAFAGYRAGIEKQRDGALVDWRVAIESQKDGNGNWTGHRVLLVKDDVDARKAAIERGQALAAKRAKTAKKPAAKKKAA